MREGEQRTQAVGGSTAVRLPRGFARQRPFYTGTLAAEHRPPAATGRGTEVRATLLKYRIAAFNAGATERSPNYKPSNCED